MRREKRIWFDDSLQSYKKSFYTTGSEDLENDRKKNNLATM